MPAYVTRRGRQLAVLAGLLVLLGGFSLTRAVHGVPQSGERPTIVHVHGAFADASSWNGAAERLQQQGYSVVAPATPLRGLTADSAYLSSVVQQIAGPVLLVAHS